MKRSGKLLSLSLMALVTPRSGLSRDLVQVKWNSDVREYCHVVRFPQGWKQPSSVRTKYGNEVVPPRFELAVSDYEFRIPGILGTRFLVRSVEDYSFEKFYTLNLYAVYLFDPTSVPQSADDKEWESATVVSLRYKGPADVITKYVQSLDLHVALGGNHSAGFTISSYRSTVVFQSWRGTLGHDSSSDAPGDVSAIFTFRPSHGRLFFDVYAADTRKKLITIAATFANVYPGVIFDKSGWVTERYFFVPLDDRREKCLVCDFGRKQQ